MLRRVAGFKLEASMHRLRDNAGPGFTEKAEAAAAVEWATSRELVGYEAAVSFMERRAEAIAAGEAAEFIWLLEHPSLFTAGTSAKPGDLLWPDRFPVFKTGRGGQYTYHGPGQRVIYVMLDVKRRTGDVRAFVGLLEAWTIDALAQIGIVGETRSDRVGVWVRRDERGASAEDKIAAIGIRVRRWVSFHGISINVSPDLAHFDGIVPCGVREHGVTSLADLGRKEGMAELDAALADAFKRRVGPILPVAAPVLTPG
jgi:lipoyl(octanoyl) transferase